MMNYDKIREELKEIITPDSVFVCIGTNKNIFDRFGPLCGTLLKRNNIPCYGDMSYPITAINMYSRLDVIYKTHNHIDANIIAIDASVTSSEEKVNQLELRHTGVKPGAGVGCKFPMVGENSIVMYTLSIGDLRTTMEAYHTFGLDVGMKYDLCNEELMLKQAKIITDYITEIYQEVTGGIII